MKIKFKLILDIIMAVIMLLVLKYDFTGGLLHEVIGLVLIGGFLLHIIFNKKYVSSIVKILKAKKNRISNIIRLVLNIILFAGMILMLISSVCISKDVFGTLNTNVNHFEIWRFIHITCAYVMLCVIFIHILMHRKLFLGILKKHTNYTYESKTWNIFVRIAALICAVIILKSSIENIAESINILGSQYLYSKTYVTDYVYNGNVSKQSDNTSPIDNLNQSETQATEDSKKETQTTITQSEGSQKETQPTIAQTENSTKQSLNDYLGKLTCTGCSKHCSLLSPRCKTGEVQKTAAIQQYNELS